MDRFLKVTRAKLIVMCLATLLPIIVITALPPILKEHFKVYTDLMALRYVLFVLVEGVIIKKIVNYILILKKEEYANKAYVKLHDERLVFVKMKSCALTIKIILYVLSIITVAFGFIDRNIFYTLLIVIFIIVITLVSTFLYYHRKY